MNRFQFVADHHTRYGVKRLCQIIGVARSSYYCWKSTAPERTARDAAELQDTGQPVNHKRVARMMRRYRIQGLRLRRRVTTTIADPAASKAPDLLIGRDFSAGAVNQRYVDHITYLPVGERGFLT